MYYLSFDCETTGLLPKCNVLTTYFAILDENLNIIDELDIKIKHDYYIVFTKALEINKIDLIQHEQNSISIIEANSQILKFLKKYETQYRIIGHNIKFDIDMLLSNKLLSIDIIKLYFDKDFYLDTYKIAQLLKSKKKINKCQSLSLSKLCYYFDININLEENFHNCKYDTQCTIELFKKLIELKN